MHHWFLPRAITSAVVLNGFLKFASIKSLPSRHLPVFSSSLAATIKEAICRTDILTIQSPVMATYCSLVNVIDRPCCDGIRTGMMLVELGSAESSPDQSNSNAVHKPSQ